MNEIPKHAAARAVRRPPWTPPRLRASAALRKISRVLSVLSASLALGACAAEDAAPEPQPWISPIPFDTAALTISGDSTTRRLLVEVARTEEERAFGLMQRPSLADSSGMVFLYDTPQPGTSGFWMFQTHVPLDIAFFDSAGAIVAVLQMEPCPSPYPDVCRSYAPGVPYVGALEVNRGWFARQGLGVGARVDLSGVR
jgi:uncharacterized membrane protein (UPF0127 family)